MMTKFKMSKRIILTLLIMTFLIQTMAFAAVQYPPDIIGKPYENDVKVLMGLGFIENNSLEMFSPDVTVTRAKMAQMAVKLMNIEVSESSAALYSDVPSGYYAANEINLVSGYGLMSGRGNGLFCPEEFTTYADALTVCLRVLGYRERAESTGGEYPYNYYALANEIKLTNGIGSVGLKDNIKRSELAVLIRNTLESEVYQKVSISGNSIKYEAVKGETLLYLNHNIDFFKGIVNANEITSLSNTDTMPDNYVKIGNTLLKTGNTAISDMLGHNVLVYYNIDEETVLAYEDITNKILEISAENIDSFSNSVLRYTSNRREISLSVPSDMYIIYNKKASTVYSPSVFLPQNGGLTFVDNNNDGKYDVVFVDNYVAKVVEKTNSIAEVIVYTDGSTTKTNEDGVEVTVIDVDGIKTPYSSLMKDDVANIFKSDDGKTIIIYQTKTKISGTLKSIGSENNRPYLYIEGEEKEERYSAIPGFESLYPDLRAGVSGTFMFDMKGHIAGFSKNDAGSKIYGYFITAKQKSVYDETVNMKIYTQLGKMTFTELADKVEVDGDLIEKTKVIARLADSNGELKPCLMRISYNGDGKINFIDTKARGANETENTLFETYNAKVKGEYHTNPMCFQSSEKVMHLEQTAFIFSVPATNVSTAQEDDFAILSTSSIDNGDTFYYTAYRTDPALIGAEAIVLNAGTVLTYSQYETMCFISKITTVSKENGDIVHKVSYIKNNSPAEAFTRDLDVMKGRHVGDALFLHFDINGIIDGYELYFKGDELALAASGNPSSSNYNSKRRTLFGAIYYVKNDLLIACMNEARLPNITDYVMESSCESHRKPYKTFCVFDTKRNTVRKADWEEMCDYLSDNQNYSRIFIYSVYSRDYDMMFVI